ncbi:MAG TPA: DNA-processing protein DprA [Gammaproteobacteria bacterium]|jgi:DNA processing protein|nr:DNA-processing protein DprA [Gammaproteobacteria bacterium]
MTKTLPYWLAALYLPNLGPRTFLQYLSYFSDIEKLFQATNEELLALKMRPEHIHAIRHPQWDIVEKTIAWRNQSGHALLCLDDPDYPVQLKQLSDPPLVLFVRGQVSVLHQFQIALVGSRRATPTGLRNAEQLAIELAQAGVVITSGLALGIDGAAHRGTLSVKGTTIAVCGTGVDCVYPRSHLSLAEEIVHCGGAIVSEFPLGVPPLATNFPRRNRVISGLSAGVLVVEAALKSGSLITVRYALEQGRDVFAVPGSIRQPLSQGCHYLLRQGAKLVETAKDILEEFKMPVQCDAVPAASVTSKEALSEVAGQIFNHIEYEITSLDMILCRTGVTAACASSALLSLELNGYIKSVSGGYIRIA